MSNGDTVNTPTPEIVWPKGFVPSLEAVRAVREAYANGKQSEREWIEWVLARFEEVLKNHDGIGGEVAQLTMRTFRAIWETRKG